MGNKGRSIRSYTLRNMPADVYKIVLDQQNEEKKIRNTNQFGFPATIFKIIREFARCKEAGHQPQIGK